LAWQQTLYHHHQLQTLNPPSFPSLPSSCGCKIICLLLKISRPNVNGLCKICVQRTHIITLSSKIISLFCYQQVFLIIRLMICCQQTLSLSCMHACPFLLSVQESHPFTNSHTICQEKFEDSMLENCIIQKSIISPYFSFTKCCFFCSLGKQSIFFENFNISTLV
jgi:hypothetical protein